MDATFTPSSQQVAKDLYSLLRDLDPNHLREEASASMRVRVQSLRERVAELVTGMDEGAAGPAVDGVRKRLSEVGQQMDAWLPAAEAAVEKWAAFRDKLSPTYEALASSLSHLDVHLPRLRPTNYARNVYHVGNAVFCLVLVHWFLDVSSAILVAGAVSALAWSMEISRRVFPGINEMLMAAFRPFAHPHEAWRVNSATWYVTALLIIACLQNLTIVGVAILVLGLADPAAALVGRRYGRTVLVNGRTLEGTGAFVVVGTISSWLWLMTAESLAPGLSLALALGASVPSAVAELCSRRIDDNLTIPVSAALGQLAVMAALGI